MTIRILFAGCMLAGCSSAALRAPDPPRGKTWQGVNQGYIHREESKSATSSSNSLSGGTTVTMRESRRAESLVVQHRRVTPPAHLAPGDIVTPVRLETHGEP